MRLAALSTGSCRSQWNREFTFQPRPEQHHVLEGPSGQLQDAGWINFDLIIGLCI